MQYLGAFSGNSPVIKRYKASATGMAAGVIVCAQANGSSGQMIVTAATATVNQLGSLLDTGNLNGAPVTYSATQGADEAVYGVIVNPDQMLRALMVTGATGTALTADTIVTATASGLTTIGGTSVASPDMDMGLVWYLSGANVGRSRTIGSTSSVTATVIVPFLANAIGDTFVYAGLNIGLQGMTLTTSVQNVRSDIAASTGVLATAIDFELNGIYDSYVTATLGDCVWCQTT